MLIPFAPVLSIDDGARARSRNHIIAELSDRQYNSLAQWLEPRAMRAGEVLCRLGQSSDFVYFVEKGLASTQAMTTRGRTIEVAAVGPEGMVGVCGFLGSLVCLTHSVCTIRGSLYRLSTQALVRELRADERLSALLQRYAGMFVAQLAQSALCARLHSSVERCARWLLEAHDSVGDDIPVIHEQLSVLLGLRRVTVTAATCQLRRLGAVAYRRGVIKVRDRTALQRAACDCYPVRCDWRASAGPLPVS